MTWQQRRWPYIRFNAVVSGVVLASILVRICAMWAAPDYWDWLRLAALVAVFMLNTLWAVKGLEERP